MGDLTVVLFTLERPPRAWAGWHLAQLRSAIGPAALIVVSVTPVAGVDLNLLQPDVQTSENLGAQQARAVAQVTTPYVAFAEDDTLYPPEHFRVRPARGTVAYNLTRWGLWTWRAPEYVWRGVSYANATLIGDTAAVREAYAARPTPTAREIGRVPAERALATEVWTLAPVIQVVHDQGLDPLAQRHRKRPGHLRAYDVPYWGHAATIHQRWHA